MWVGMAVGQVGESKQFDKGTRKVMEYQGKCQKGKVPEDIIATLGSPACVCV